MYLLPLHIHSLFFLCMKCLKSHPCRAVRLVALARVFRTVRWVPQTIPDKKHEMLFLILSFFQISPFLTFRIPELHLTYLTALEYFSPWFHWDFAAKIFFARFLWKSFIVACRELFRENIVINNSPTCLFV